MMRFIESCGSTGTLKFYNHGLNAGLKQAINYDLNNKFIYTNCFMQTQTDLIKVINEIAADETLWDAQFVATNNNKLSDLVAQVENEIDAGTTLPMFDKRGKFIEHT